MAGVSDTRKVAMSKQIINQRRKQQEGREDGMELHRRMREIDTVAARHQAQAGGQNGRPTHGTKMKMKPIGKGRSNHQLISREGRGIHVSPSVRDQRPPQTVNTFQYTPVGNESASIMSRSSSAGSAVEKHGDYEEKDDHREFFGSEDGYGRGIEDNHLDGNDDEEEDEDNYENKENSMEIMAGAGSQEGWGQREEELNRSTENNKALRDGYIADGKLIGTVDRDAQRTFDIKKTARTRGWKSYKILDDEDLLPQSSFARLMVQEVGYGDKVKTANDQEHYWNDIRATVIKGMQDARNHATQNIKEAFMGKCHNQNRCQT